VGRQKTSLESLEWRKSSFSQTGDSVEWAGDGDHVYVRDSKGDPRDVLKFTYSEWQAFIAGVRSGEAELDAGCISGD
jgi:Domain of unknown function (DUF397)